MITADSLTDEQIRELRATAWEWADGAEASYVVTECSIALAKFRDPAGAATVAEARARVAEILNARGKAVPTLVCSRCGAPVHRSWDHLDIGEHGERWTCDARTKAAQP